MWSPEWQPPELIGDRYPGAVGQLSFFSADSQTPELTDLAGVLAGHGQSVTQGDRARISVVLSDSWRIPALSEMFEQLSLHVSVGTSDEGHPLVAAGPDARLRPLVQAWSRGAVKSVPSTWIPSPRALRAWVIVAGVGDGSKCDLGVDPRAPDTHPVLATSLMRAGMAPTLVGTRGRHPTLRITGRRRLSRLGDTVGQAPPGSEHVWPAMM